MNRKRIGVVGFGPSGLSFLAQFLETNPSPREYEILLFDSDQEGLGDAFREQPRYNLMNTSVAVTSLFAQKPDDFRDWLNENPSEWRQHFPEKPSFDGDEIPPRFLFGRYLRARREDVFERCVERELPVLRINERVIDLLPSAAGHTILTESKTTWDVDYVLIFTGNFKRITFPNLHGSKGYLASPYEHAVNGGAPSEHSSVLVVGTNLSAIDAILRASADQYTTRIVAASRTGTLPAPNHAIDLRNARPNRWLNRESFESYRRADPPTGAAATLDQLFKNAWEEVGSTWDVGQFLSDDPAERLHSQVTGGATGHESLILPLAQLLESLWWDLTPADRAEILTRYFKTIMHFVGAFPVENARKLLHLIHDKRLHFRRQLATVEATPEGVFRASFQDGSSELFDFVIDSTGYDNGLSCTQLSPLMRSIAERKYFHLNGFGGLNVTSDYQVTSSATTGTRVYSAGFPIKASVPFANWFNRIVSATNRIAHAIQEDHNHVV